MKECAKECVSTNQSCRNKKCRQWIKYKNDLNCTLVAVNKNGRMTLEEVGKRHQVSIVRAKQLIDGALVKLKKRLKTWTGYPFPDLSTDPNYPKCSDKIPVGTGVKKQSQQYSGKRKLLGIGTMHKSNLVPIWDEEGAKEISKMRRN